MRLLILAEVTLYGQALAQVLSQLGTVAIVEAAFPDEAGVQRVAVLKPDVVLIDAASVRPHIVRRIKALSSAVRVVAFAMTEEEPQVVACAEAGVDGFAGRDASLPQLVTILESAVRGELLCSPRVAAVVCRRVAALAALQPEPGIGATLTAREREILRLIEEGLSNKDIARRLNVETATVKNHVHNLLEKLRVRRRGEAAALGRRAVLDQGRAASA